VLHYPWWNMQNQLANRDRQRHLCSCCLRSAMALRSMGYHWTRKFARTNVSKGGVVKIRHWMRGHREKIGLAEKHNPTLDSSCLAEYHMVTNDGS
jgi:hypothetical protein